MRVRHQVDRRMYDENHAEENLEVNDDVIIYGGYVISY